MWTLKIEGRKTKEQEMYLYTQLESVTSIPRCLEENSMLFFTSSCANTTRIDLFFLFCAFLFFNPFLQSVKL